MKYLSHKIKSSGYIEISEKTNDDKIHRFVVPPNQKLTKYNDIIESDPDFQNYRTKENEDIYEEKRKQLNSSKEQKKRQAEQKAREKALEQLIKKEMDESGITEELNNEKNKINKE